MDIFRRNGIEDKEETVDDPAQIMDKSDLQHMGQNDAQNKYDAAQPNLLLEGQFFHHKAPFRGGFRKKRTIKEPYMSRRVPCALAYCGV